MDRRTDLVDDDFGDDLERLPLDLLDAEVPLDHLVHIISHRFVLSYHITSYGASASYQDPGVSDHIASRITWNTK